MLPESHAGQQASYSLPLHPQLADVYGNVFCIRLGRHKTVFLSGWKMVKDALVTQADNFVDRPYSPMVNRIYSGNSGKPGSDMSSDKCRDETSGVSPAQLLLGDLHLHSHDLLSLCLCVSAGLFFSNGKVWRTQRRFAMAMLRTFGLAKSSTERSICEESQHLQEEMEKEKG